MDDSLKVIKEEVVEKIPEFTSPEFEKLKRKMIDELKKKESYNRILRRSLKILILGDWNTPAKKERLNKIKDVLLKNELYAYTIDNYYDMDKKDGLSPIQILETCCINHQLIVLLDGEGGGTLREQNYLSDTYPLHSRLLYFIDDLKFTKYKDTPTEYFKDFPTIYPYKDEDDLIDKILTYSRLRIYRLAEIITKQSSTGRGLKKSGYESMKARIGWFLGK